jgi:hypothetical protein
MAGKAFSILQLEQRKLRALLRRPYCRARSGPPRITSVDADDEAQNPRAFALISGWNLPFSVSPCLRGELMPSFSVRR